MSQDPAPTTNFGPLRRAAASGAKWTASSTAVMIACQFGQVAVLARLLEPRDFGLAASVMVVVGLARAFADGGMSNAIIAKQTSDPGRLSSLYWANVLIGSGVAVAVVASAPLVALFFQQPELEALVPIAALGFLIQPFGQQFGVLLQRDLRFKGLAKLDAYSAVVGAAATITAAAAGWGAASILFGFVIQAFVRTAVLAAVGCRTWRPSLRLRRRDLDGYLSFGAYQMAERSTNYLGANMDYLMIGRFLGPEALGIYAIAYQLIVIPKTRLNPILTRVAFPIFARRQDDDETLRNGFLEVSRLLAMATFPLLAGLAVVAPQFIPVVYGPQWTESIPIVQIEVIVGALFVLGNPLGSLLLAKDRPDIGFKLTVLRLVTLTLAVGVAVQYGLVAVACAYVGAVLFQFVVTRVVLWRVVGLSWQKYLASIRQPVLLSLAMAAAVAVATPLLSLATDSDAALLAMQIALGAGVLALLLGLTARPYVRSVLAVVAPRPQAG